MIRTVVACVCVSVCVWHVKRVPRNLPQHLPLPHNETYTIDETTTHVHSHMAIIRLQLLLLAAALSPAPALQLRLPLRLPRVSRHRVPHLLSQDDQLVALKELLQAANLTQSPREVRERRAII